MRGDGRLGFDGGGGMLSGIDVLLGLLIGVGVGRQDVCSIGVGGALLSPRRGVRKTRALLSELCQTGHDTGTNELQSVDSRSDHSRGIGHERMVQTSDLIGDVDGGATAKGDGGRLPVRQRLCCGRGLGQGWSAKEKHGQNEAPAAWLATHPRDGLAAPLWVSGPACQRNVRPKCPRSVYWRPLKSRSLRPVASKSHGIAKQQRHAVPEHSAVECRWLPGSQPAPKPVSVMCNLGEARECASGEHQQESGLLHSARKLSHPSHVGRDLARMNSCKIVRARAPVAVLLPLWHVTACDGGRGM